MSDKLSLADMMAAMELDQFTVTPKELESLREKEFSLSANNPTTRRVVGKSFLTRNFTLFSTPYFRMYLQGVKEVDNLQEDDIESFLKLCTVVPINYRGTLTPEIAQYIEGTLESKSYLKFYTDKAFHKEWIESLIALGGKLDRVKVANRAKVLESIRDYLTSLESYLIRKGYDSARHYLDYNSTSPAIQFNEGWDNDL